MKLSFIIPTLNEAGYIDDCLSSLQPARKHGHEVIVVDGGSSDNTVAVSVNSADRVVNAGYNHRAIQMNKGAEHARGDVLVFLHADSQLTEQAVQFLAWSITTDHCWGRFDVRLSGSHPLFRIIEWFMNTRSRLTGIATGDQVIFVTRDLFQQVGGFPEIAIMEDIALTKILRTYRPPLCLSEKVIISSRRWDKYGIIRTVLKMWWLRVRYFLGADPDTLARYYEHQK